MRTRLYSGENSLLHDPHDNGSDFNPAKVCKVITFMECCRKEVNENEISYGTLSRSVLLIISNINLGRLCKIFVSEK